MAVNIVRVKYAMKRYAAEHGMSDEEALKAGMAEKSAEFREQGAEVYHEQ